MNWGTAIKTVFSKYATFAGVASRSEYWYWVLFTFVVGVGFNIPNGIASRIPFTQPPSVDSSRYFRGFLFSAPFFLG